MTRHKAWNPHGLLSTITVIVFMQLGWIEAKPSTSLEDEANSLKCLLRKVPPEPCVKLTGYMLPNRLIQLHENMGEEMKGSIKSRKLGNLAPEVFATLPSQLFLLIPSRHLQPVSATSLTALLKSNLHDLAVTIKIMGILNVAKAEEFFSKLEGVDLPYRVQDKIAETLVKWLPDVKSNWTFPRFRMIDKVGDPLIAHVPPHFLANLSQSAAVRFLYHFRNWLWSYLPENVWNGKLESAKRIWADTMFRSSYPVNVKNWTENEGRRFRYLLEGATPDELKLLTFQQLQNAKLFKAKLSKLQVRALFNITYPNGSLTSANLSDAQLLPVALQLSPENLQKFNITSTDFKVLPTASLEKCSYSTALQILESLIAQSVFAGRLKNVRPETWGNGIEHLGKFIYVVPPSALESYRLNTPSLLAQLSVDSDKLLPRQARLLAGRIAVDLEKPDVMLGRKGLLKALQSSQIANKATLPQNVLSHLLSNLPSGMHMQAAVLLVKVGKIKGKTWALKSILSNKNPNLYFKLLDSQTVTMLETDLREIKGFDNAIKSLPQNTLSALLTSRRTKLTSQNVLWTSDSLLSEDNVNFLLGLSCNDIYAMETVDFMYIMEMYNKKRELLNKPFPKDLQYCSQMALINYLEMKASLQDDRTLDQLLDYLEPADIEAVGGYVLGNLPLKAINQSQWKLLILETIGQLSLPELIVATKEESPWKVAKLLMQQYVSLNHSASLKELFGLSNLFQFLTSTDIMNINSTSFKLFLESLGNSKSKTVCADSSTRSAWYQLILKSFGEPSKWTAGVLETLGDMLVVVPHKGLNSIPEESWKEAADVLLDKTSYHLKLEWPGNTEHVSFYQACAELLETTEASHYVSAVRELIRWYLSAVQDQLNNVMTASHLLTITHRAMKGRADRKLIKDLPLEVVQPESVVKVLDTRVEQPIRIDRPWIEKHTTVSGNFHENDNSYEDYDSDTLFESTTENLITTQTVLNKFESSSSGATSSLSVPTEFPLLSELTIYYSNQASAPKALSESSSTVHNEITTSIPELQMLSTAITSRPNNKQEFNDSKSIQETKMTLLHENATTNASTMKVGSSLQTELASNYSETSTAIPVTTTLSKNKSRTDISNNTNSNSSVHVIEGKSLASLNESVLLKVADGEVSVNASVEKTITKRHANVEENSEINDHHNAANNPIEQSGDVLRGVLKNKMVTKENDQSHTTTEAGLSEINPTVKPRMNNLGKPWQKISCNAIKAAGPAAGIPLDETDIEHMDIRELEDCLDTLGSLELDKSVQQKIWNSVNKVKFFENLSDLGNLVRILDINDISNINVNLFTPHALDNLAILSKMVTDSHVLQEIAQHFVKSNPDLKTFTTEITIALGRILCDVVEVMPQKLHDLMGPSVFLRASSVLGQMKSCPTHCLHKLAHTATKNSEYGPPDTWTPEDVTTLGITIAGLKAEQWKQLRSTGYGNNPLVGLQPTAVRYIPPQIFKELNEDQLKSLPTLSAAVVSEEQLSHLSESQHQALMRVQKEVPVLRHTSINEIQYSDQSDSSITNLPLKNVCLLVAVLTVML